MFPAEMSRTVTQETLDARFSLAEDISATESGTLPEEGVLLPSPTVDFIRSDFDIQAADPRNQIVRCFGTDEVGALIRKEN